MIQNSFELFFKPAVKIFKLTNNKLALNSAKNVELNHIINEESERVVNKNKLFLDKELNVSLIVLLSFSTANTRLTVLKSSGEIMFSKSAGSVGLKGNQKIYRKLSVKKLLVKLNHEKKLFVKSEVPIALHLKNVSSYHLKQAVTMVRNSFVIGSLKIYNNPPFNGCRKRKMRRKKSSRIIKR